MNAKALRLITITAAVALTSLGTVSAAQAKQGADDTTPQVSSSASATPGADDTTPHVSGADDATPHVSGADDATPHVSGADDAVPHVSGADSANDPASSHRHGKKNHKAGKRHTGVHTAAHK